MLGSETSMLMSDYQWMSRKKILSLSVSESPADHCQSSEDSSKRDTHIPQRYKRNSRSVKKQSRGSSV